MKNLFTAFGLLLAVPLLHAQNGLQQVIVEKYYVSNAADSIGSTGVLPVGSVTYRIFLDMAPGYKFETAYGNATHTLKITTTTSFFNNEDRGATTPNSITVAQSKTGTVLLDSWLSAGAAASGKMGIPKPKDTDGSIGNTSGILKNNDASTGIQVLTEDGMLPGSPSAVTIVGFQAQADSAFGAISQQSKSFISNDGAWSSLNGATGVDTANIVLIAQITTDGVFGFELNVSLGTPSNDVEEYVAKNPNGSASPVEYLNSGLTYNSNNVITGTVNKTASAKSVNVYPVPAKGELMLEMTSSGTSLSNSYRIYDLTGKLILAKELGAFADRKLERIDISSLSPGMYFMTTLSDGAESTQKLIKQ